jgi:hypothetical protein
MKTSDEKKIESLKSQYENYLIIIAKRKELSLQMAQYFMKMTKTITQMRNEKVI